MKVKNDPRSEFSNLSNWKEEAFNGIRTRDLRDTGAWKIHCEDHSSLSSMTAVQIYELFHIYLHHFTPHGKI